MTLTKQEAEIFHVKMSYINIALRYQCSVQNLQIVYDKEYTLKIIL